MNNDTLVFQSVNSTALQAIAYDPATSEMRVRYHVPGCPLGKDGVPCNCEGKGRVWRYPDTPPQAHENLLAAPSIGKHFHANWTKRGIKGESV